MPNDKIVWTQSGSGVRGNVNMEAPVPEYGLPQPVLNTANGSGPEYGVVFPEKRGGDPYQEATPDFLPDSASIPEDSTDVQQQSESR